MSEPLEADVVVVGAGIAGSSLAYALAGAGGSVVVLEAVEQYEDRVRGEQMHAWGVKEARDLGVEPVLLAAGAHVTPAWRQFIEGAPEPTDLPLSIMVPGVDGTLNLRHPDACAALSNAASEAGAHVLRGVQKVALSGRDPVTVRYQHDGHSHEVRAGVVVGADGRGSTVRRQIGVTLDRQEPSNYIAGLLLDDLDISDDFDVMVSEGDIFFLLFHQGNGRARGYIVVGKSSQHRFSGRKATDEFLAALDLATYPCSKELQAATPAGPCATYPGDDTWTDAPFADGVLLIGDAAGHNDPIIGEGLAIAMRDARTARDLLLAGARTAEAFRPYGEERVERMRRLRLLADVVTVTFAEDATNRPARREWLGARMAAMDPEVFPLVVGVFAGPETVPDELLDSRILDRIRAA